MTESLHPRAGDMQDRSLVGELGSHVLQSNRALAEQLESMQMCLRSPELWSPHHNQRGAHAATETGQPDVHAAAPPAFSQQGETSKETEALKQLSSI